MPDRDRLIFHIDVNSAFLSWTALERLAQGDSVDLRTIPAIVGAILPPDMAWYWPNPSPPRPSVSLRGSLWSTPCGNVLIWSWPLRIIPCTAKKAGCSWNICQVSARTLNRSALMNVIWIIPRSRCSIPLRKLPLLTFVILCGKNFILL